MGDLDPDLARTVPTSSVVDSPDHETTGRLAPLLIALAGVLSYLNSFQGVFVFDEHDWIIDNPHIRHLWPPWQALFAPENVGRPLVSLSNAINYQISGLNPWSYHAVNLVIHIAAGLALYGIVHRTLMTDRLRERFGAHASVLGLLVALIWLVHPLQTQSVTYVMQRCESLMGMCYLVCLYCAIRSQDSPGPPREAKACTPKRHKWQWYGFSIAACAGGMLSKQVMVTAPVMVVIYDFVFTAGGLKEILKKRWPLYAGLAATWILLVATVLSEPTLNAGFALKSISSLDYFKTQLGVVVYYLRLSIWPNPLCLDHTGWPIAKTIREILPGAAILGCLGIGTLWGLVKRRPISFLGVWFFLILGVTSSVMPIADVAVEHRMYLPLAAVAAFAVLGLYTIAVNVRIRFGLQPRPLGLAGLTAATLVIASLGFVTLRRNIDYTSEVVMWSDVIRKNPVSTRAHSNLGKALIDQGRTDDAIEQLQTAVSIDPLFEPARCTLGLALCLAGRYSEARDQLARAISLSPTEPNAHANLGRVLSEMGQLDEAITEFDRAVEITPDSASAHCNLATALVQQGKTGEAMEQYSRALSIDPGYEPAHCNLGMALYVAGRLPEAGEQLRQALTLNPEDALAHCDLGRVLSDEGQIGDAADEFARAIHIKPDYAEAYVRLGAELEKAGRLDDAREQYKLAAQLRPEWAAKLAGRAAGNK